MNFIFISPHFPTNYWHFCHALAQRGVNVLGIGDCPYDALAHELKMALTEYYRVGSMENYDEMYKAVAYFAFKYGPIDWLESNNEYWLERDAQLRTAFHITTGFSSDPRMARSELHPDSHPHILEVIKKSEMKRFYALAGVPSCRYVVSTEGIDEALHFAQRVGYPLFCRPNVRNARLDVVPLADEAALTQFFDETAPHGEYIIEPFVTGDIWSYDAIIDADGLPIIESCCIYPPIAGIVARGLDSTHYIPPTIDPQLCHAGRRVVKAYGVRSRFVHLEFFRLSFDHEELGHKGDFVGLEVNMRPGGGYMPEMIGLALGTDAYGLWADMICGTTASDAPALASDGRYTLFVGRRDTAAYLHSHDDILAAYPTELSMTARVPDALSDMLGNNAYIARFATLEDMEAYTRYVTERQA